MKRTAVNRPRDRVPAVLMTLLLAMLLLAPAATAQDWVIECVDGWREFTAMSDRYLRLDVAGEAHLAYGGVGLYYAWHDAGGWHVETVDSSRYVGQHASLALDPSGNPHIAYYDHLYCDLKYAHRDSAGWHVQTVDMAGDVGSYASIDVDGSGHAHISYYDDSQGDLEYAYQDASGWHVLTPDQTGDVGEYSSLALDDAGGVHIAYLDDSNDFVKYAWKDGPQWTFEVADSLAGYNAADISLAVDTRHQPHVGYVRSGRVAYAHKDSLGWHTQEVTAGSGMAYETCIALGGDDYPHISYAWVYSPSTHGVGHVYRDAAGWHNEGISSSLGYYTSVGVTAAGSVHIAYYNPGSGYWANRLRHASNDGGTWTTGTIDSEGYLGLYTSIGIDKGGRPRASYYDSYNGDLKYASHDAMGWHIEIADSAGRVGSHSSLALDASGCPHISYYDETSEDLRYAYRDPSGWHTEPVDAAGSVGMYSSLALDGTGRPHISYLDETNQQVKYARHDGTCWQTAAVGTATGSRGGHTCLALDASGNPHISYCDGSSLKYASDYGMGWTTETVDVSGIVGTYSSLALDGGNHPHISYYDEGNSALKYARKGLGWQVETVHGDPGYDLGSYSSLALDCQGYPHISYHEDWHYYGYGWLHYAYKDQTGWHLQAPDGDTVGKYTCLALCVGTYPHISYFDNVAGDLLHAYVEGPASMLLSGSLAGGELALTWTAYPAAFEYWVYGAANDVFFPEGWAPGYANRLAIVSGATHTWSSPNGITNPDSNWAYLIIAVDSSGSERGRSNRYGEHDFDTGD